MSLGGDLYDLQFKIIPKICTLYEDAIKIFETFDDLKVINKKFMKRYFPDDYLEWDDYKFEKKVLPNNAIEYIYDYGEPPRFPLCRFAIFYVDRAQNIFKYFTLEKTIMFRDYPYMLCGQKGEQHLNYMYECPAQFEVFEKMVQNIIEKKIEPVTGTKIK